MSLQWLGRARSGRKIRVHWVFLWWSLCQIGLWARERAVKSYSRATRRGGGSCQLVYRHETPSARSSWRPPAARFWELLGAKRGGRIKFRPRAAHHSKSAPIRGIRRQGKPPPFLGRDNYLRRGGPLPGPPRARCDQACGLVAWRVGGDIESLPRGAVWRIGLRACGRAA